MENDFSALKSLNELKNLLDSGAITQAEYDVLKKKIIFGNAAPETTPIPETPVSPRQDFTPPPVVPPVPHRVEGNPITPEYNRVIEPVTPIYTTPVRETSPAYYDMPINQAEELQEVKQRDWLLTILISLGVLLLLGLIGYQLLDKDDSENLTSTSGPQTEEVKTEDSELTSPELNTDATESTRADRIDGATVPAVGTPTTTETATPPVTETPTAPAKPAISNDEAFDRIKDRLESYYDDMAATPFNAQRHFAPAVERYYTLTNTTPAAINENIQSYHFNEFQNSESSIENGSMKIENNNENGFEVTYIENGSAFRKSKGQKQETKAKVRAKFDSNYKMTYFRQEQLLENKFIEE